jgi:hypothetical protein
MPKMVPVRGRFLRGPGKCCSSAVLKKVLAHDHIRILKQTADAFTENDAVRCYGRLVNNLVLMVL